MISQVRTFVLGSACPDRLFHRSVQGPAARKADGPLSLLRSLDRSQTHPVCRTRARGRGVQTEYFDVLAARLARDMARFYPQKGFAVLVVPTAVSPGIPGWEGGTG